LYHKWESAVDIADGDNSDKPLIVYSTESSHLWTNKKVFCNNIDGELWHGILMTNDTVDNLESIKIQLEGTNSQNKQWKSEFLWHSSDVVLNSKPFNALGSTDNSSLVLFTPFKHPLVLINECLSVAVSFNFNDGRLPKESQIKIVYGVCNNVLVKWLEKCSGLKIQLSHDSKLTFNIPNNTVDETSRA
jgi:hypothetical protein